MPPRTVQSHFRAVFSEWGLPCIIRVDNGAPWGSWNDLPPVLALWVIGLGVEMHWNHPRCPEENAVIERSQSLAQSWGEPTLCWTVREFQYRIHREDRLQREVYPSVNGISRMQAFPTLRHSGRHYSLAWERRHWSWDRVLTHLAGYAVTRRVDSSGKIGLYSSKLYVGSTYKRQQVYVSLDPQRIEWIVRDPKGQQLRAVPADELTPQAVRSMRLAPDWRGQGGAH